MVNGAIGMAFSTVTKLFLMIGMTNLNLPKDAEEGDLFLDPIKNLWLVYKDDEWIEVDLKKYHRSNYIHFDAK